MPHGGWGETRLKKIALCHPEVNHYARGLCRQCYQRNSDRSEMRKKYYQAHKDDWKKHYKKHSRTRTAKRYGLTVEQLDAMTAAQGGLCAVCSRQPGKKGLAVDHHHATGVVRGLLCSSCNTAIGLLRDDPELMEKAAQYARNCNPL